MDYRPRAESVRITAAAAYLPFVAIVLLMQRQHDDVRLIRFHAYQALGLAGLLFACMLVGSIASTLLSAVPALGFLLNLAVGVYFMALLIGFAGLTFYSAAMAYQGNYTRIPLVTDWVWERVNRGEPPLDPLAEPQAEPRRRRRRRAPDGDELP